MFCTQTPRMAISALVRIFNDRGCERSYVTLEHYITGQSLVEVRLMPIPTLTYRVFVALREIWRQSESTLRNAWGALIPS